MFLARIIREDVEECLFKELSMVLKACVNFKDFIILGWASLKTLNVNESLCVSAD